MFGLNCDVGESSHSESSPSGLLRCIYLTLLLYPCDTATIITPYMLDTLLTSRHNPAMHLYRFHPVFSPALIPIWFHPMSILYSHSASQHTGPLPLPSWFICFDLGSTGTVHCTVFSSNIFNLKACLTPNVMAMQCDWCTYSTPGSSGSKSNILYCNPYCTVPSFLCCYNLDLDQKPTHPNTCMTTHWSLVTGDYHRLTVCVSHMYVPWKHVYWLTFTCTNLKLMVNIHMQYYMCSISLYIL